MYFCTVTGNCKHTLNGNEVNRGLSTEYIYIEQSLLQSNAALLLSVLMCHIRDYALSNFGSLAYLSAIEDLTLFLKDYYEYEKHTS